MCWLRGACVSVCVSMGVCVCGCVCLWVCVSVGRGCGCVSPCVCVSACVCVSIWVRLYGVGGVCVYVCVCVWWWKQIHLSLESGTSRVVLPGPGLVCQVCSDTPHGLLVCHLHGFSWGFLTWFSWACLGRWVSHTKGFSSHQPGVLNSVLTLSTHREHQIPQAQSYMTTVCFRCQ